MRKSLKSDLFWCYGYVAVMLKMYVIFCEPPVFSLLYCNSERDFLFFFCLFILSTLIKGNYSKHAVCFVLSLNNGFCRGISVPNLFSWKLPKAIIVSFFVDTFFCFPEFRQDIFKTQLLCSSFDWLRHFVLYTVDILFLWFFYFTVYMWI